MAFYSEKDIKQADRFLFVLVNNFFDVTRVGLTRLVMEEGFSHTIDVRSLSYFIEEAELLHRNIPAAKLSPDCWAAVARKLGTNQIRFDQFILGLAGALTTNTDEHFFELTTQSIQALFTQNLSRLAEFRFHESVLVRSGLHSISSPNNHHHGFANNSALFPAASAGV